jgi:hypothetical protein
MNSLWLCREITSGANNISTPIERGDRLLGCDALDGFGPRAEEQADWINDELHSATPLQCIGHAGSAVPDSIVYLHNHLSC